LTSLRLDVPKRLYVAVMWGIASSLSAIVPSALDENPNSVWFVGIPFTAVLASYLVVGLMAFKVSKTGQGHGWLRFGRILAIVLPILASLGFGVAGLLFFAIFFGVPTVLLSSIRD